MATEVITKVVDDLARKAGHRVEANQTVEFSFDGQSYSIDLTDSNAAALKAAVRPFVEAAAPVTKRATTKRATTKPKDDGAAAKGNAKATKPNQERTQAIREWAPRNGYTIGERGRIPSEVVAAWEAAGSPGLDVVRTTPLPEGVTMSSDSAPEPLPNDGDVPESAEPQIDFATSG